LTPSARSASIAAAMEDGTKAGEERPAGEVRRRGGARPRPDAGHGPPRRPARTVSPRRRPPPPGGLRGGIARVIGLAATLVLLGVGVAVVLTLTRDNAPAKPESFAPTPAAKATPARKRRSGPRAPQLTTAQRASRDAAVEQMRRQGFEPVSVAAYKPRQSLRVLIGRPKASMAIRGRRAFFFVREQYIGTDAASPSARLKVASQNGREITLAYTRYAAGDKPCCPSDGTVKVRFAMGDGRLQPLDPIPPAASRLPPS
jgi:hypothetical protein